MLAVVLPVVADVLEESVMEIDVEDAVTEDAVTLELSVVEFSLDRRRRSASPRSGAWSTPPPQAQHASPAGGVAPATLDAKLLLASVQPWGTTTVHIQPS